MSARDLLTSSAAVYTPTSGSGGQFTTLAVSGVACRLSGLSPQMAAGRAELIDVRVLYYDTGYTMPAQAEVVIDGEHWTVVRGSLTAPLDPRTRQPAYRAAEVVKVTT